MNERIREFAEHAELPNPHTPGSWTFNNDQLQFFADLIIQECIHAVENTNDRYRRDYFAEKIREHFGVES